MSYLYLLVDDAGSGFKIGVSVDPSQRMAALPEKIDSTKSFQIKCGEKNSYRVEKTLHLLFSNHHLKKEKGDGYTEWFSMNCFDAVQDFIRSQRDLLGWTHFETIPEPTIKSINIPKPLISTEERRENKERRIKTKLIGDAISNNISIKAFSVWIDLLREQNVLVGLFNDKTCLVILNTDPLQEDVIDYVPHDLGALHYKTPRVSGGARIIQSSHTDYSLKYSYVEMFDITQLDQAYLLDFSSTGFSEDPIQTLRNIIESIPIIIEPQLNEVLAEYKVSRNRFLHDFYLFK